MVESMEDAAPATATTAAAIISSTSLSTKRKLKQGKGKKKPYKKLKPFPQPKNPSQKMKKLFKKRVRAYSSDGEEEEEEEEEEVKAQEEAVLEDDDESKEEEAKEDDGSDDDLQNHREDGYDLGITKFAEGCSAFRTAFRKSINSHLPNDPLGPILAAQKKLVAEKLLEEETERKTKGEAKKEKHLAGEKGHVKPANFLDTKEKLLISIATKGVVKLFNAVNKAQNPQKGLNPSRSRDAKELAKRRKQTFLSELEKSTPGTTDSSSAFNSSKFTKSVNKENEDEPGWAPLRDSYMLNSSKAKDWNKMADPAAVADQGTLPFDGSSDED